MRGMKKLMENEYCRHDWKPSLTTSVLLLSECVHHLHNVNLWHSKLKFTVAICSNYMFKLKGSH